MKTKTIILVLCILAILVAVKVIYLTPEKAVSQKGGKPKKAAILVSGYVVKGVELKNKIYSSGTIFANEEVVLKPEVQGKLLSILFKEGSFVSKGKLLAKINDADLQAQLHKLELQVNLAKQKETRLKSLLNIKGTSEEEYDASSNQVQTLEADMDFLKSQIAKTEIRAPFDGTIGLKQISEGSFVTNSTVISSMQQTNFLKIDFTVPEKYANMISIEDTVQFTVDTGNEKFTASIVAIEPRIDLQTRNLLIRARFENTQPFIYPGAFARIELISGKKIQALMIPTEAVVPELKGKKVFVSRNGKAIPVRVETGTRTDSQIEIINGITEGDTILVTGIMSLKPEDNIQFINLKSK